MYNFWIAVQLSNGDEYQGVICARDEDQARRIVEDQAGDHSLTFKEVTRL